MHAFRSFEHPLYNPRALYKLFQHDLQLIVWSKNTVVEANKDQYFKMVINLGHT